MPTFDLGDIISIITAIGFILRLLWEGKNSVSAIQTNLIKNVADLTEQNIGLQTQVNDKQDQINELKEEMTTIKADKYQLIINIVGGQKPLIEEISIKPILV